jgi:protein-S-isoprenylcysteine O-methyltransferase Ste14
MVMDPWLRLIAFLLLTVISVTSAWYRTRANRMGGRVKHPAFTGGRVWLLIPLRLLLIVFLVSCFIDPSWMHWAHLGLPEAARWAGIGVAAIGDVLMWWMFHHLGLNVTPVADPRADATLVTTGPYRYIRHPLYSFATLCLLGIGMAIDNGAFIVFPLGAFTLMAIRVPREEAMLVEKFGDAYREYRSRTGRFLPRLRGSMTP